MKILVPIDFSKTSLVATHYAAEIARVYNAEIILLHAVYISTPPRASVAMKLKDIENTMAENAKEDILPIVNDLLKKFPGLIVSHEIIRKKPLDEVIATYSNFNKIDLIVMGTKGASGLSKILIGSNTNTIINKCTIPLIAVPEFAEFNGLKKIIYASDLSNIDNELKPIVALAKLFNSEILLLHVLRDSPINTIDVKQLKSNIITTHQFDNISIHISINEDIIDAIDDFITESNPDMLVLFTHKLTLFEKIFGRNITQEMSFHSKIPMFTLKKNTEVSV